MLPLASNIAFFGHVDCGKSTTIGRLLVDTNSINPKQTTRKSGSKINYAWITDELEEERKRGITMDIMIKSINTNDIVLNIIDTPGHMDYIPNLIKGLCQANIAVYIVDVTIGSFESTLGQSIIEHTPFKPYTMNKSTLCTHIMLAKSFGISSIIILLNKMDAIDYNQDRFDSISSTIEECLNKYHYKKDSYEIIPISAIDGINIVEDISILSNNSPLDWYKGHSLLTTLRRYHEINQSRILEQNSNEQTLYISVFDFYEDKANYVTIVGRILQGMFPSNSKLLISPSNQIVHVKEIYRNNSELLSSHAYSNDFVTMNVTNCDFEQLRRGDIITQKDHILINNFKIECSVITTDINHTITPGIHLVYHSYNITTNIAITKLIQQTLKTGIVKNPLIIKSNTFAKLEIIFEKPCCIQEFTHCKALGRFCLMSLGGIVAVGVVDTIRLFWRHTHHNVLTYKCIIHI